jgi:hypothetical protein
MQTSLRKHSALLTLAALLVMGVLAVYAASLLTATTGTLTITTYPPTPANVFIMNAQLNWGSGGEGYSEPCTVSPDQTSVTCATQPSQYNGPVLTTVYVGDQFQLMIAFGNSGTLSGTLNSITFQGSLTVQSDGQFTLQNFQPCNPNPNGCGAQPPVNLSYPITIPSTLSGGQPTQLAWTIHVDSVGSGTDAAIFTFNISG